MDGKPRSQGPGAVEWPVLVWAAEGGAWQIEEVNQEGYLMYLLWLNVISKIHMLET